MTSVSSFRPSVPSGPNVSVLYAYLLSHPSSSRRYSAVVACTRVSSSYFIRKSCRPLNAAARDHVPTLDARSVPSAPLFDRKLAPPHSENPEANHRMELALLWQN